ncbi:MAG TPA: hypothetical protein VMI56_25225 [Reyranella sp.]|nr:hypothetical protein [Reyranella sp.]
MNRRTFLAGSSGAGLLAGLPADVLAQAVPPPSQPSSSSWDHGKVRHILPTVSDTAFLIKVSFNAPRQAVPLLKINDASTAGHMTDTAGLFWQFLITDLQPGREHTLSLVDPGSGALCEPWKLSTFPAVDSKVDHCRVLFYTCAGGYANMGTAVGSFLPPEIRNRLLRRALSFSPHAVVANGDHVYWDLLAPKASPMLGASPEAIKIAGTFDRSMPGLGGKNETVLKLATGPQIQPVYGTDFRSTPVFFIQDDHDYFDNDEATDQIITFPPSWFMLQLARATQSLYYPEYLPDLTRPLGLPSSDAGDRLGKVSETFGTLRYGSLVEVLLYDIRRTLTLAGPSAVYVDREAEKWLINRTRASAKEVTHLVHAPSNPPGWSAGKWGEWYPDVLGSDGKLTVATPKPYWQPGWLSQHDRLVKAMGENRERIPLIISGDLHAVAIGQMKRSGDIDLGKNPVTAVLSGPIGTSPGGWPSAFRGVGAMPPRHLDMVEEVKPIEQHSFTMVDFERDKITLRFFKWDLKSQPPEAIDSLQPFHSTVLTRHA